MAVPQIHFDDEQRTGLPHVAHGTTSREAPPKGLPLGLSLGLILAMAVAIVLGAITGLDQRREMIMDRDVHEARLEARLAELGTELETVTNPADLGPALERFRAAAESATGEEHGVALLGAPDDRITVATAGRAPSRPPRSALRASIEVSCPAIEGGAGRLDAWQSGRTLAADRSRLWRDWALDLLLTSLAVILAVEIAVHLLVGRPLSRMVRSLRRLEQGHLGPLDPGPGAWELRWLAWRFESLGRDLADNARRLVAAERRALDASRSLAAVRPTARSVEDRSVISDAAAFPTGRSAQDKLARQYLEDTCRLLDTLRPDQPYAHDIAEEAWSKAVIEAERLGDAGLKAQLEDGALRILEHGTFAELDLELEMIKRQRRQWSRTIAERLQEALVEAQVQIGEIQHRVKHTAGVWRKMREAGLAVEQVHDLFAFRIIVPTVTDCYLALAAVHGAFEPEPFRFKDYIERPKANGYRSLHTTVRDSEGHLFEVQIRSQAMHDAAENGNAAHWRYRTERWGSLASLRSKRFWRRESLFPRHRHQP